MRLVGLDGNCASWAAPTWLLTTTNAIKAHNWDKAAKIEQQVAHHDHSNFNDTEKIDWINASTI